MCGECMGVCRCADVCRCMWACVGGHGQVCMGARGSVRVCAGVRWMNFQNTYWRLES